MHEYLFDVKLFAAIRVKAKTEAEARELIKSCIDANTANLGAWPNGDPIICEVSLDEPDNDELIEIDGEDPLLLDSEGDNPFHPESPEGRAYGDGRMNEDGSLIG